MAIVIGNLFRGTCMKNRISELYDNYRLVRYSMGESMVSIARYLIKQRGYKTLIYGAGNYGTLCNRMLIDNAGIRVDLIIDKNPKVDILEGVPVIQRDELEKDDFRVAFVCLKQYSLNCEVNSDIYYFLRKKGIDIIIDMASMIECFEPDYYVFLIKNKKRFVTQYELFEDEISKDTFYEYISSYLSGTAYSGITYGEEYKYWGGGLFSIKDERWVNCGASIGDTIFDFYSMRVSIKHIYAIEGDKNVYEELCRNINFLRLDERKQISTYNVYIGDGDNEESIDNIVGEEEITLINMDIEGNESIALASAAETIRKNHPVLAICVYHKPGDLIEIPTQILRYYGDYKFYLRKYASTGGIHYRGRTRLNELVMYAVPFDRIIH